MIRFGRRAVVGYRGWMDEGDRKPDDGDPTRQERASTARVREPARPAGDRYELRGRLGQGGMGEVLVARDEQLGRDVAIKRMLVDEPSSGAIDRFLREARVQGRLDHPSIVPVHELGRDVEGMPYFVMKKVSGTTLAAILENGDTTKFSRQRLLRAFVDVCLAIEFAHVRGIIHRDLKPANIVLGDYGETYVLDWGIAKVLGEDDPSFADLGSSGTGSQATEIGSSIGTPGYMAPEQVRGAAELDARADVYALGCVLFELLSGKRRQPKGADGTVEEVDPRPSVRAPERQIPLELDAVCVEATRSDPDQRPQSARELAARIDRFLDGDRDLAARRERSRSHLEQAQHAMESTDRKTAMREAGRALAIDPGMSEAAEIVTRLMIEPPAETPPEVLAELERDTRNAAASYLKLAVWIFAGFLAITPALWWIGPEGGSGWVPVLAASIVFGAFLNWFAAKNPSLARVLICIVWSGVIVAVVARMYSPLLIAPGLATLFGMASTITMIAPTWVERTIIPGIGILSIVGVWIAERVGLLSKTTAVTADGVVTLHVAAAGGNEGPILTVAALYVVILIVATSLFASAIRSSEHALKLKIHLQAWQLRQLVA